MKAPHVGSWKKGPFFQSGIVTSALRLGAHEPVGVSLSRSPPEEKQLPLHTLICNAAVMALPERRVTGDGLEYQFEVDR